MGYTSEQNKDPCFHGDNILAEGKNRYIFKIITFKYKNHFENKNKYTNGDDVGRHPRQHKKGRGAELSVGEKGAQECMELRTQMQEQKANRRGVIRWSLTPVLPLTNLGNFPDTLFLYL